MAKQPRKTIEDIANDLGRYPVDAFEFLTEGLDYTVRKIHGPPNNVIENLVRWMRENNVDPEDIDILLEEGNLPKPVLDAIEHFGGAAAFRQKTDRHIAGQELCWGLRDLALEKWGVLAPAVLGCWGIRRTLDFGRMVFALVDNELLQKRPEDRIEDFDNVFDFDRAFRGTYKIVLPGGED